MKKNKNNDQSEKKEEQISDYEDMLNSFSERDEVKGGNEEKSDDGINLSKIFDKTDGQESEEKSEEGTETDELKEFNLDDISDLTFDDIKSEDLDVIDESEAKEETVLREDSGKLELDMEEIEQEGSSDYSSVLSEINIGETAETEIELDEIKTAEIEVEEVSLEELPEATIQEIPVTEEGADVSYANLIEDESEKSPIEETAAETEDVSFEELTVESEDQSMETDKDVFEKLADTEYSIEDEETVSNANMEFSTPAESEPKKESFASDFSAGEKPEETFVIGGTEAEEMEEDFLKLDQESSSDSGILAGVAGAKQNIPIEVMLEGIEMDADEQISTVTHAEILLAQGKEKEAIKLYTHVSEKRGVTPFVSKRLRELNIRNSNESKSATAEESTTETETTIESEPE